MLNRKPLSPLCSVSCVVPISTAQVLGMELLDKMEMDGSGFTLYFLAYLSEEEQSLSAEQKAKSKFDRQGDCFEFRLGHGALLRRKLHVCRRPRIDTQPRHRI